MRFALHSFLLFVTLGCQRETLHLLREGVEAGSRGGAGGDSARVFVDGAASGCVESGQCGGRRQHCDRLTGHCVECVSASDCVSPLTCDLVAHECSVPCTKDGDCPSNGTPHCSVRGVCVECREDDRDCSSQRDRFCERVSSRCVECLKDDNCQNAQAPLCDPEHFFCAECLRDDQCSSGGHCDSGHCVVNR